jgi:hypothetical protein
MAFLGLSFFQSTSHESNFLSVITAATKKQEGELRMILPSTGQGFDQADMQSKFPQL